MRMAGYVMFHLTTHGNNRWQMKDHAGSQRQVSRVLTVSHRYWCMFNSFIIILCVLSTHHALHRYKYHSKPLQNTGRSCKAETDDVQYMHSCGKLQSKKHINVYISHTHAVNSLAPSIPLNKNTCWGQCIFRLHRMVNK